MKCYSTEDLHEAERSLASTLNKCEKIIPKFALGTSQHTLLSRRINALKISLELIQRELEGPNG
jgi:hypothetical protein